MSFGIPPPSNKALSVLSGVKDAVSSASSIFSKVYFVSDERRIRLRDDRLIPATRFSPRNDVFYVTGTGSGKTFRIVASALTHPDSITLVFSPLLALQSDTVSAHNTFEDVYETAHCR
jgi:hypothetical protein